jgi:hypothetical protein
MSTKLTGRIGEGLEGSFGIIARGVVENDVIRAAFVVIGGWNVDGSVRHAGGKSATAGQQGTQDPNT